MLLLAAGFGGCTYVRTTVKQAGYSARQAGTPRQRIYKHMLARETFFVFGRIENAPADLPEPLAVVALSDRPTAGEVVDVNHVARADSFYGLNLPAGEFRLLVVSDRNRDGFYTADEIAGARTVALDTASVPDRVLGECDLDLRPAAPPADAPAVAFRLAVPPARPRAESVFFPKGTLRTLDDPIFDPAMATLGMYEPAAFLEAAPMMFYALEEQAPHKIPVIFVHGIGGSARDFAPLVARLDRTRFQPWFFHYPSGADLRQNATMFYKIFLSGKLIPLEDFPVAIVAHSMGGLVVREAFNLRTGAKRETPVHRFVTLASPLGGHPAARAAVRAPVVLPSWRDLDPGSTFIAGLHRRPLPAELRYHLLFAFGDDRTVKLGGNSDGVVPLASQLDPAAQNEAAAQQGFDTTHTGILRDPAAIERTLALAAEVRSAFPEDHLRELRRGGYDLALGPHYSRIEAHLVRHIGRYMDALVDGTIRPFHPVQEHFLQVCRGEKSARYPAESAWLKLQRDFPGRRSSAPAAAAP